MRHAYAATHRYDPSVAWLRELVSDGDIGTVREIVMTIRAGFPSVMPWSWMRMLEAGGGVLNNLLPHLLGILERVTDGETTYVMGEARVVADKAPVVPDVHDFRHWIRTGRELTPETAKKFEWRACDADGAFSALMRIAAPTSDISVTLVHGLGQSVPGEVTGMRLYGDTGTLIANGVVGFTVSRMRAGRDAPETLEVPQRLKDDLPQVGDHVQNKWCALARDFVADIRGESHERYLTFRDGWRYQQAIEAIRSRQGWSGIRTESAE